MVEMTERQRQWLGSEEEEQFFDEMMKAADTVEFAKSVVRQKQKDTADYWHSMSVLCRHKAFLIGARK